MQPPARRPIRAALLGTILILAPGARALTCGSLQEPPPEDAPPAAGAPDAPGQIESAPPAETPREGETAPESPAPESAPPQIPPEVQSPFLTRTYKIRPAKLWKGLLESLQAEGFPPEEVSEQTRTVKTSFVDFNQDKYQNQVAEPPQRLGVWYPLGTPPPGGMVRPVMDLLAQWPGPSASVLAVLRRETAGRRQPAKTVAVLADPVFEPDDPRLRAASGAAGRSANQAPKMAHSAEARPPASQALRDFEAGRSGKLSFPRLAATRQEADAIVAMAPQGMTLRAIDFDASRATAMSPELAQYRIVHFATHGVFDNETPGLSAIMLSMFDQRGQARDGFLRLHDIYGLQLPTELVVLSACNTALGKQVRGEGLVGIVRGFMYAGAKRVVASLWKVDDEATGEMMSRFYLEMLQHDRSPAAALREAQLAMWRQKRWQPPFYWAAFVLQGEWK